jgi:predicted MFS family arabinose efflux permease
VICHLDNGILAVSNETIKKDLGIEESDMGLLQSGLYVGNVIGSILSPVLFAKMQAKNIIVGSSILNALFVGVFAFTKNFWILFATRSFVGFFQVMFVIYFPVWIDLCAPQKSSTMWISCFFLTVPIGIIFGYGITIGL